MRRGGERGFDEIAWRRRGRGWTVGHGHGQLVADHGVLEPDETRRADHHRLDARAAAVVGLAFGLQEALRPVCRCGDPDRPDRLVHLGRNREAFRCFDPKDGRILLSDRTGAITGGELGLVQLEIGIGGEHGPDDVSAREHRRGRRCGERHGEFNAASDRRRLHIDDAVWRRWIGPFRRHYRCALWPAQRGRRDRRNGESGRIAGDRLGRRQQNWRACGRRRRGLGCRSLGRCRRGRCHGRRRLGDVHDQHVAFEIVLDRQFVLGGDGDDIAAVGVLALEIRKVGRRRYAQVGEIRLGALCELQRQRTLALTGNPVAGF